METLFLRLSSICLRCRLSLRLPHASSRLPHASTRLPHPSTRLPQPSTRQFTTSHAQLAGTDPTPPPSTDPPPTSSSISRLMDAFNFGGKRSPSFSADPIRRNLPLSPPHHLHVYATKHNTHITLTRPNRSPIISVSAGNIGFRKAARGTYDAGYQLGAYVMGRIQQEGLLGEIFFVEVVLRGFGPGREAVSKVLLGSEGRNLRTKVVRVTDATRLKFGGTRSSKPRRLG